MNKRNVITGIGGGFLLVLLILLVAAGVMKRAHANQLADTEYALQARPRPVKVEKVEATTLVQSHRYPGKVRASEEAALSFRVGGPLVMVDVELGRPVKKDDLLMQIDPRDFEDRIVSLEAQLSGAQAVYENARQDFERAKKLFDEGVIPPADYDRATGALDSASAGVKNLKAQLLITRHSLADTELRAPYDGRVTAQLVENREMVRAGQVVLNFHNIQWLEVDVNIPENEMVRRHLEPGSPAHIRFSARPDSLYEVKLKEWSSEADSLTRTYVVTFRFQAPKDLQVLPGMSADILWAEDSGESEQITVPLSALASTAEGDSFVWVYDEEAQEALARPVKTGRLHGTSRSVITKGLEGGERVVVTGSRLLQAGAEISVTTL